MNGACLQGVAPTAPTTGPREVVLDEWHRPAVEGRTVTIDEARDWFLASKRLSRRYYRSTIYDAAQLRDATKQAAGAAKGE